MLQTNHKLALRVIWHACHDKPPRMLACRLARGMALAQVTAFLGLPNITQERLYMPS